MKRDRWKQTIDRNHWHAWQCHLPLKQKCTSDSGVRRRRSIEAIQNVVSTAYSLHMHAKAFRIALDEKKTHRCRFLEISTVHAD